MLKQWLCALTMVLLLAGTALADIWSAAKDGDTQAVQKEIERGVDVNARDDQSKTALHWAAQYGRTDTVSFLLEHGADVMAKYGDDTSLHLAAGSGHVGVVTLLIKFGADVNAKDAKGRTALSFARGWNRHESAELLRAAGAEE